VFRLASGREVCSDRAHGGFDLSGRVIEICDAPDVY
jgi:hypothetical protein